MHLYVCMHIYSESMRREAQKRVQDTKTAEHYYEIMRTSV